MRTLIVGVGALGGMVAARLMANGAAVALATRDDESALRLRAFGLQVTGVGGAVAVPAGHAASLDEHISRTDRYDLIVHATKAAAAGAVADAAMGLLAAEGVLVPLQNGGVPQILGERLGTANLLGGLAHYGVTMAAPGRFEQRNAGGILIGELPGSCHGGARAQAVAAWLCRGIDARVAADFPGAMWAKLLLNCAVTTVGAITGTTLRSVLGLPGGREVFQGAYDEALGVALAAGIRPQRMLVDPIPPGWSHDDRASRPSQAHDAWVAGVVAGYGDLKASMLQDFDRGRSTEIDVINGHVVAVGRGAGVATPVNAAIVATVHAISRGERPLGPGNLRHILQQAQPGAAFFAHP